MEINVKNKPLGCMNHVIKVKPDLYTLSGPCSPLKKDLSHFLTHSEQTNANSDKCVHWKVNQSRVSAVVAAKFEFCGIRVYGVFRNAFFQQYAGRWC